MPTVIGRPRQGEETGTHKQQAAQPALRA
jgi:hypothetical protein